MDAIETLMTEHRLIERTLDALEAYVDGLRRRGLAAGPAGEGSDEEKQEPSKFVTFVREFADACHHGKEEGILFTEMVARGFPSQGGPIAVMLHEHDLGRALIRQLGELAAQEGAWSVADRQQIAEVAHRYAGLLRQHIQKEDTVLYPMAEAHLPPEALASIGERVEQFEREQTGQGAHERFHALAEELIARHAPELDRAREHVPVHACGGCHGH